MRKFAAAQNYFLILQVISWFNVKRYKEMF